MRAPGEVPPDSIHDSGETLLALANITLSFGGLTALKDVSLNVRKGEIRAIIGPNGAGKTSLINCINGFYHPQSGTNTFKGVTRKRVRPHHVAREGIARTFQNVALFKGMSTLDNIMTGRILKMRTNFLLQALYWGPNLREENAHREACEHIIDFLEIQAIRNTPVGRLPYAEARRAPPGPRHGARPVAASRWRA